MKTIFMAITFTLILIGCGDYSVVKDNDHSVTTDNNNTDTHYTVTLDGNATYTNDGSGKDDPYFGDAKFDKNYSESECNAAGYFYCNITKECIDQPLKGGSCSASGGNGTTLGRYDATYNQSECTQAGYFYCTIEQKCLNQPLRSGSCSR